MMEERESANEKKKMGLGKGVSLVYPRKAVYFSVEAFLSDLEG